eukprot:Trichotokara_eunicae@DN1168_c0_g1_i1.p1
MCLDTMGDESPGSDLTLTKCQSSSNSSQSFIYFKKSKHITPLFNDEQCLAGGLFPYKTDWCRKGEQRWEYKNELLINLRTMDCLRTNSAGLLEYSECDVEDPYQKWHWPKYIVPATFTPPPISGRKKQI